MTPERLVKRVEKLEQSRPADRGCSVTTEGGYDVISINGKVIAKLEEGLFAEL